MRSATHVVAIWLLTVGAAFGQSAVMLTHVHGLAYSTDGKSLMIPSHHGLAVYRNGRWSKAPGPQHDYMGFAATADALYSSGHPAPGSGFINPFGLIRSRDGGRTWEKLGLEGETDFHVMATGWKSRAIYVWNPAPSSRIANPGLHVTVDDGTSWRPARAAGVEGDPHALAAHPTDAKRVALATSRGVFESADGGQTFRRVAGVGEGTAVFYDLDGKHLWIGTHDGRQAHLARAPVRGGMPAQIDLPALENDAVSFIAQNPVRRAEYAIATFRRSVFLSPDAGRTWSPIADQGRGVNSPEGKP